MTAPGAASTYVPGSAAALVGPGLAVLTAGRHVALLAQFLERATAHRSVSTLEMIGLLSGGDLAAVPDFAFAATEPDGLRLVARGSYRIDAGGEQVTGAGAATWVDRLVQQAGDVLLRTGDAAEVTPASSEPAAAECPVVSGVVLAAQVRWRPVGIAVPTAMPVPPVADADHDGLTVMASAATVGTPRARVQVTGQPAVTVRTRVLIGRSPRATQTSSSQLPVLVVLDDPYVSGTHLEIGFRDGVLVAIDRSTNGTLIILPGHSPERLHKGQPAVVVDGTRLVLATGIEATVSLGDSDG